MHVIPAPMHLAAALFDRPEDARWHLKPLPYIHMPNVMAPIVLDWYASATGSINELCYLAHKHLVLTGSVPDKWNPTGDC